MASKLLRSSLILNQIPRRYKSSRHEDAFRRALDTIPLTEQSVCNNNLKVATQSLDVDATTVGVFIQAGSRYEDPAQHGACNLITRLLYKGTSKRAEADIQAEVAKIGARLYAETSRELTAVYGTCLNKDVPKLIEILSDVVQNAKFSDADVEQAKNQVLQEHSQVEANLPEITMDYLHTTAFMNTPLAQNRIGTEENIKAFHGKELKYFVDTHFKASRTVLAAAGGVNHREIQQLAEQHLGKLDDTFDGTPSGILSKCRYTGSEFRVRDDSIPVAHIAFGVKGCGVDSPDRLPLDIAAACLGKWHKKEGQNEDTLDGVLNYEAFNLCYTGTGLFGVYGVVDIPEDYCFEFCQQIVYNLHRLSRQIPDADLETAKRMLIHQHLLKTDGPRGNCLDIGKQVSELGQRVSVKDFVESVQKTNNDLIRETVEKYVHNKCQVISTIGKNENLQDYNLFRNMMYKWV